MIVLLAFSAVAGVYYLQDVNGDNFFDNLPDEQKGFVISPGVYGLFVPVGNSLLLGRYDRIFCGSLFQQL